MTTTEILAIAVVALAVVTFLGFRFLRRRNVPQVGKNKNNKQVYVGNLSYRVSEFQIKKFFSQFGRINELKIVRDSRTRRSKGYGFVTYTQSTEAHKALKADGETFEGRVLVVRIAKDRP